MYPKPHDKSSRKQESSGQNICIVFFVWIPVVSRCYLNKYAIINGVFHNFEIENSHHWWTKLEGLIIKCGKGSWKALSEAHSRVKF